MEEMGKPPPKQTLVVGLLACTYARCPLVWVSVDAGHLLRTVCPRNADRGAADSGRWAVLGSAELTGRIVGTDWVETGRVVWLPAAAGAN